MGGSAFTGSKQVPDISDQVSVITLEVVDGFITTTYIGRAKPGADISKEDWTVQRITTDSASGTTRVEWAEKDFGKGLKATARFVHTVTDMTALTYS